MDVLLSYTLQTNLLHDTNAEFDTCDEFKPIFDSSQISFASCSILKALFLLCARKELLESHPVKAWTAGRNWHIVVYNWLTNFVYSN